MNTLKEINTVLQAVLDMTEIARDEYLIVSSAAEYIAGLATRFGDIDIVVTKKTFTRLQKNMFQSTTKDFAGQKTRVIRIGMVDIIELEEEEWLKAPRNQHAIYPILSDVYLIKWRIRIGREKDQLRAWQMIHKLTPKSLQQIDLEPRVIPGAVDQILFGLSNKLMELA